jgi:hypothetical protein
MKFVSFRNVSIAAGALLLVNSAPLAQAAAADGETGTAAVAAPAVVAPALPAAAPLPDPVAAEAEALKPGGFVWHPERAQAGEVEIVVSVPLQRGYIYRGDTLIGVTTVSTGRPGHRTPLGRFAILEKHRQHFSNKYNNAPMPFMQRLTMDGIALHAGQIPGRPASHGCVRLPLAFAEKLFAVTRVGGDVHIVDGALGAEQALALVRRGPAPGIALASAN